MFADALPIAEAIRKEVVRILSKDKPAKKHPQVNIEFEGCTIGIDTELVSLMRCLWQQGFVTIGCCQECKPGRAYVRFLAAGFGATRFHRELKAIGIECDSQLCEPQFRQSYDYGLEPFCSLTVFAVNVFFPSQEIQKITEHFHNLRR